MKAIILNYLDGSINVAELPISLMDNNYAYQTEKIEDYLHQELGFELDEIHYMTCDEDCPIYPCGEDNPAPIYVIR